MVFELVPKKVFVASTCQEAQRSNCRHKDRHVHVSCGDTNNWPAFSLAMLTTMLLILEAAGHITTAERENASRLVSSRNEDCFSCLESELTAGDSSRLHDTVFFLGKGEDPLGASYRTQAPAIVRAAFFPS